ncbi:hypothetical protein A0H81_14021 [Grifola frondosa]|uniref:Uncharacterized protein n=1 Tax=Grifola frondosa TaxID=5627 RepID=A0A1C7LMK9_GRIFR|nr:hypothetical protein A0H81_14021 [Grifola frondosa]
MQASSIGLLQRWFSPTSYRDKLQERFKYGQSPLQSPESEQQPRAEGLARTLEIGVRGTLRWQGFGHRSAGTDADKRPWNVQDAITSMLIVDIHLRKEASNELVLSFAEASAPSSSLHARRKTLANVVLGYADVRWPADIRNFTILPASSPGEVIDRSDLQRVSR